MCGVEDTGVCGGYWGVLRILGFVEDTVVLGCRGVRRMLGAWVLCAVH